MIFSPPSAVEASGDPHRVTHRRLAFPSLQNETSTPRTSAIATDHIIRMGPGKFDGPKTGIIKRHGGEYCTEGPAPPASRPAISQRLAGLQPSKL